MSWSDLFNSATDTVEGWFGGGIHNGEAVPAEVAAQEIASYAPQQGQLSNADIADIDGQAMPNPVSEGGDSGAWYTKALKGIMPTLAGAALKPHQQARAPVAPSGHGVNVNATGLMKPIDELRSSANNNPLADINKWAGLFK